MTKDGTRFFGACSRVGANKFVFSYTFIFIVWTKLELKDHLVVACGWQRFDVMFYFIYS
jgi:hypothetical protein